MELLADLGGVVTDFAVAGPHMDCICGRELIRLDKHTGGILMRKIIADGRLIAVNRQSSLMKERRVSDSSMWSVTVYGGNLVCGTVDGKVLLLDKASLSVKKELALGKKNIGSLLLDGDTLYAAGHDGRLFRISMEGFEPAAAVKNAHRKMFHCAGIYGNMLVTVSYPCSEIAFWDRDTLEKLNVLQIPLKLSGRAYIENGALYISSRNISGIGIIRLK